MPTYSKWRLSVMFRHQNSIRTSPPHTCYTLRPSHCSWFDHPNNIWWGIQIMQLLLLLPRPSQAQISSLTLCSQTASAYVSTAVWERNCDCHTYKRTGKIIVLCILMFILVYRKLEGSREECIPNEGRQSRSSVCVWLLRVWNFGLLRLFTNILNVPPVQKIYKHL